MRLYDQQSGELVWQLQHDRAAAEIGVREPARFVECGKHWTFSAPEKQARLLLPSLDFTAVAGPWLDLEIDICREPGRVAPAGGAGEAASAGGAPVPTSRVDAS
jgi:hypothetical protein